MIQGYYYLHINGALIYKPGSDCVADFRDSDFVRSFWPLDPSDRETCWRLLIESSALGAIPTRVRELSETWGCNDADAAVYADRVGCNLFMDGDQWCATDMHFTNLHDCEAGFGNTALEAMADFCEKLGYKPSKMWGAKFPDLLHKPENVQFGVGA